MNFDVSGTYESQLCFFKWNHIPFNALIDAARHSLYRNINWFIPKKNLSNLMCKGQGQTLSGILVFTLSSSFIH